MGNDLSLVANRYAKAIFELAVDAKEEDKTASDLRSWADLLDEHASLSDALTKPTQSVKNAQNIIQAIAEKAGTSTLVRHALFVLAANRRIIALKHVVSAFDAMLREHKGEAIAHVVSASTLDSTQQKNMAKALSKAFGKDVHVEASLDESILGGVIINIGSKRIDHSLVGKLEKLAQDSKQAMANLSQ